MWVQTRKGPFAVVRLTTDDALMIRQALDIVAQRAAAREPADDGHVGKTDTWGWERRGRGMAGELATRRHLGLQTTRSDLTDSYAAGDVRLPTGVVVECRTVQASHYRLPRYDHDRPGRYWVLAVVTNAALETLREGEAAEVALQSWVAPIDCDNRRNWVPSPYARCYWIDPRVLRGTPLVLSEHAD